MKLRGWGTLGLFVFVLGAEASANVYRYVLEGFPKQTGGCHQAALAAGKSFEEHAGIKPLSASCLSESSRGYEIEIRYESESKVPTVSTIDYIAALDYVGRFKTKELCAERREVEIALFRQETGLEPVFAYCYEDNLSRTRPWALRIDGFGESDRNFYISGYPIFGVPEEISGAQYSAQLREGLAARGANLVDAVIHSQLAMAQVSLHFYASERIRFHSEEYGKFPDVASCTGLLSEVKRGLAESANAPILAYCGRVPSFGMIEITAVYAGEPSVEKRLAIERFESYAACEADRARLIGYYQTELGRPVRTGVCTREAGGRDFRLLLLEEVVKN